MLDQTTSKGRILKAALDCAAAKSWADVTLGDVSQAATVPLAEMRDQFASKNDILAGLLRAIDDEVLKRAPKPAEGQAKRDALFDIIMSRFDILAPFKPALKSIHASGSADFALAAPYLASQHWMLEAAGIGTDGVGGGLRVAGLGLAYASVFKTWLEDDDPGLAKTMAALDRRLRRGERTMDGLAEVNKGVARFGDALQEMVRTLSRGRPKPEPKPDTKTNSEPGPSTV